MTEGKEKKGGVIAASSQSLTSPKGKKRKKTNAFSLEGGKKKKAI